MGILTSSLPLLSTDSVAIYNAEGDQIFVGEKTLVNQLSGGRLGTRNQAQPMSASVRDISRSFSHPLDNNETLTDHRIILPVEIDIAMVVTKDDNNNIFNQVEDYYLRGDEVTVKLKAREYKRMIVTAIPHRETKEVFNGLMLNVSFKEYDPSNRIKTDVPESPDQFSTKAIGQAVLDFLI